MEVFSIGIFFKISAEPNPLQSMASCSKNTEVREQQRTVEVLLPVETTAPKYRQK